MSYHFGSDRNIHSLAFRHFSHCFSLLQSKKKLLALGQKIPQYNCVNPLDMYALGFKTFFLNVLQQFFHTLLILGQPRRPFQNDQNLTSLTKMGNIRDTTSMTTKLSTEYVYYITLHITQNSQLYWEIQQLQSTIHELFSL